MASSLPDATNLRPGRPDTIGPVTRNNRPGTQTQDSGGQIDVTCSAEEEDTRWRKKMRRRPADAVHRSDSLLRRRGVNGETREFILRC
jgi:hypothetical protein